MNGRLANLKKAAGSYEDWVASCAWHDALTAPTKAKCAACSKAPAKDAGTVGAEAGGESEARPKEESAMSAGGDECPKAATFAAAAAQPHEAEVATKRPESVAKTRGDAARRTAVAKLDDNGKSFKKCKECKDDNEEKCKESKNDKGMEQAQARLAVKGVDCLVLLPEKPKKYIGSRCPPSQDEVKRRCAVDRHRGPERPPLRGAGPDERAALARRRRQDPGQDSRGAEAIKTLVARHLP